MKRSRGAVFRASPGRGGLRLRGMDTRLRFIEHLAGKLQRMEDGREPPRPRVYRVHARMLREAMAGCPAPRLMRELGCRNPAVMDALADRFFAETGLLPAPAPEARAARAVAQALLLRVSERAALVARRA